MRIRAITPIRVSEEELARRQDRYQALSADSVEVELVNLPDTPGVPTNLDSEAKIVDSEKFVVEVALATDPERFDAVLPDCVLDPGLERLRQECPVPVYGILQLSAGFLGTLGNRFASVTRNQPIGEELRRRLEAFGYSDEFDRNVVLDLAFEDIVNDTRWNDALRETVVQFEGSGTTAIINGCSAVELRHQPSESVALVDPTALSLKVIGLMSEFGLPPGGISQRTSTMRA